VDYTQLKERVNPKRSYDSSRRRVQAASTRREILAAAQHLFEQKGFAAAKMADIAAEAGVALKTVYTAFETKGGVLRALWNLRLPSWIAPGTGRCSRSPIPSVSCGSTQGIHAPSRRAWPRFWT
jgi:hypothetical protein